MKTIVIIATWEDADAPDDDGIEAYMETFRCAETPPTTLTVTDERGVLYEKNPVDGERGIDSFLLAYRG